MNARQKAKHFKRLYEEALPKKPYPVVYQTLFPKHYIAQYSIDMDYASDACVDSRVLKAVVEDRILHELRPLIWDNLIVEKDIDSRKCRYALDIWLR